MRVFHDMSRARRIMHSRLRAGHLHAGEVLRHVSHGRAGFDLAACWPRSTTTCESADVSGEVLGFHIRRTAGNLPEG